MIIIGYILLLIVGISLGLIGSGGSILTVPILLFFFGFTTDLAFFQALFIVGVSAFWGTIISIFKKNVDVRSFIVFGIPSILGVLITKSFILPAIPDTLFHVGKFEMTKDAVLLLLFSLLMLLSSSKMISTNKDADSSLVDSRPVKIHFLLIQGFFVGSLTALISVGGGFLIIPFLVLYRSIDMKKAIGTSLLIIFFNAISAFLLTLHEIPIIDLNSLFWMGGISSIGMFIGLFFQQKVNGIILKKIFGYFVLLIGIYVFIYTMIKWC